MQGDGRARGASGEEGSRAREGLRALSPAAHDRRRSFRHRLRVRYHECDPQGIVFNANYLAYADIAITELYRELFGSWTEAMKASGLDAVVAEANVRFLAPLRFDEEFDLVVSLLRVGETSTTTRVSMEREGERAAEVEVRHVFIDPAAHRPAPVPEAIRAGLGRYA